MLVYNINKEIDFNGSFRNDLKILNIVFEKNWIWNISVIIILWFVVDLKFVKKKWCEFKFLDLVYEICMSDLNFVVYIVVF